MTSTPPPLAKPELPDLVAAQRAASGRDELPAWKWWALPLGIVLGFFVGSIGDLFVSIIGAVTGASLSHPPPAVTIAGDVVFDLAFVAAAIYVVSLYGRINLSLLGFRRASPARVAWMLPLAAVAYFIITALYASLLGLHGSEQLPSGLGSTSDTAAMVAVAVFVTVIAPICEELFFRGFVFGVLRSRLAPRAWGPWVAAIATGVLFGGAHVGSAPVEYLVPLAFLGFVLCILRWRTGSLYPGMALHSINNSLALGHNELHWNAAQIAGLAIAALIAIAAIAGPAGANEPVVAVS